MFIEKIGGDKRRWRQYKARVRALPANYRTTVDGAGAQDGGTRT